MSLSDDFERISLDTIQLFVRDGREEDLYLDFKGIADPTLTSDDRRHLAVALSGFANSDGGIVIWGFNEERN